MQQGIDLLKEYVSTWNETSKLKAQLLIAICNLYLSDPDSSETGYASIEIAEEIKNVRGHGWAGSNDSDKSSNEVRKQWKLLLELWELKKTGIKQYLEKNNFDKVPELHKVEGGGSGHQSRYFIKWQASPKPVHAQKPKYPNAYDSYEVNYICEDIANAGLIARIFSKGINVSGWRRYVFATGIIVPILFGLIGIFIILFQVNQWENYGLEKIFQSFISMSLFILAVWLIVGSFIKLPDNRIVIAPLWLQSEFNDRLLELQRTPTRTIKAVHYSTKCPVCSGKVNAVSGKWEFIGRIVGRCENAPIEHVFSFDHVTRSGKSLRS